ncbi:hypothetical protein FRX31_032998, partial [Thalictrum thalictroides]
EEVRETTQEGNIDNEKPHDMEGNKGSFDIVSKVKHIDISVGLQGDMTSKDVVKEVNQNEDWEVPKRKHTYKTRWDNGGTSLEVQIGSTSKGDGGNMHSLVIPKETNLNSSQAHHDKESPEDNKDDLSLEEMGRGPGPPI